MTHVTLRPPVTPRTFVTAVVSTGFVSSAEVIDVLDQLPDTVIPSELIAISDFVDLEVLAGNWGTKAASYADSLFDQFWCFGLVTTNNALTGWHTLVPKTAVNTLATKTTDGFSFNGTTAFLDTTYDIFTDAVNHLRDNAMHGAYMQDNRDTTLASIYGARQGAPIMRLAQDTTQLRPGLNDNLNGNFAFESLFTDDGLYCASRQISTTVELFKNGVSQGTQAAASFALVAGTTVFIGGNSNNVGALQNPIDATISSFSIGAAVGFNQSQHNTDLRALLIDLGVSGVTP